MRTVRWDYSWASAPTAISATCPFARDRLSDGHPLWRSRMCLAFAAIALALVTVPTARAQSWDEYRPAGIGFRIEMPGKPKLETQKTKAGNTAYRAIATYQDMAFLAIYGDKYEKKSDDREVLLETVVKSFTEGKKVLSAKKEMIGGYPGRRVVSEDADKVKL